MQNGRPGSQLPHVDRSCAASGLQSAGSLSPVKAKEVLSAEGT